jgi:predicted DNA-binding protein (MmcQ/YjbR family)
MHFSLPLHILPACMNVEDFRAYCLSKKGTEECLPFDDTTLVFKVMDKMFALTSLDTAFRFTIKTDPDTGAHLRELYPSVKPAWHMNKKHWIMVDVDGTVADDLLKKWIDDSYRLVVNGLPLKMREKINPKS